MDCNKISYLQIDNFKVKIPEAKITYQIKLKGKNWKSTQPSTNKKDQNKQYYRNILSENITTKRHQNCKKKLNGAGDKIKWKVKQQQPELRELKKTLNKKKYQTTGDFKTRRQLVNLNKKSGGFNTSPLKGDTINAKGITQDIRNSWACSANTTETHIRWDVPSVEWTS